MRTTVTLDDDLAIRLERLSHEQGRSFKSVINEAVRAGLEVIQQIPRPNAAGEHVSYTEPFAGELLLPIEEAIEAADLDYFRKKMGN